MPLDLQKARELFLHAGNPPPERSEEYVARGCGAAAELKQQVLRLLQVHREAGSLLESPAVALGDADDDRTSAKRPTGEVQGPTAAPSGTVIGPYKLLQPIGEGGMGTVYMSEQAQPVRRIVALKLIKAGMDSRQVLARIGARIFFRSVVASLLKEYEARLERSATLPKFGITIKPKSPIGR